MADASRKKGGIIPRQTKLSDIYPTPKSSLEFANERREIDQMRAKHVPKHVTISTSFRTYSVLLGLVLGLNVIPDAIQTNIIGGVFLSFSVASLWVGYTMWIISRVSDTFQRLGLRSVRFFLLYIVIYPALALISYNLSASSSLGLWYTIATCLHFIVVYVLLKIVLKP